MRVVTYNVRGLRGGAGVARVVRSLGPDVLALQEPGLGPLGRVRVARLARRAGLRVVVFGGGARTTAILVRRDVAVASPWVVALPRSRPALRRLVPIARGGCAVQTGGLRVVVLHLGLNAEERARHLGLLARHWVDEPRVLVVGDLNERPGGPAFGVLGRHLRDLGVAAGPTFPAADPRLRIDVAFASAQVVVQRVWVADDETARRASDHLPLVVDL